MYTNVSQLINTCTPKNLITYIRKFTKFMNVCKATESWGWWRVKKSVSMRS